MKFASSMRATLCARFLCVRNVCRCGCACMHISVSSVPTACIVRRFSREMHSRERDAEKEKDEESYWDGKSSPLRNSPLLRWLRFPFRRRGGNFLFLARHSRREKKDIRARLLSAVSRDCASPNRHPRRNQWIVQYECTREYRKGG